MWTVPKSIRGVLSRCPTPDHPGHAYGLFLWCLFIAVIEGIAINRPSRSITHIYQSASQDWWSSIPVYTEGIHGFLYFPSSAVLFGPLAALPPSLCDLVWRLLIVTAFSSAVYRALTLILPGVEHRLTAWVLVAAIPTASINILRGQCEMMMLAIVMHAAVDIGQGRDRRGGWLLTLAVALKPLALVPALLFAAVRPNTRVPLSLGMIVIFAVPFAHPDPGYVAGQYTALIGKLTAAAAPDSGRWFDLTRLFTEAGGHPTYSLMTELRLVAALLTLSVAWAAVRRLDHRTGTLVTLMLSAWYLALFNPRTEEGSYLSIAVLTMLAALAERRRSRAWSNPVSVMLGVAVLGLGAHFYGDWIYRPTQMWLKQAVTLTLFVYLVWVVFAGRNLAAPATGPADGAAVVA
jgi:alpha-1,2-mannosyltransferase